MDFENAVELFHEAFKSQLKPGENVISKFKLTQSTLILEQPLVTTSNTYTFPVQSNIQNQGAQFNTEIRLNMQDTFVPTHISLAFCHPSSAVDTTFTPDNYLNPFKYVNAAAMNTLYNGTVRFVIDNKVYLKQWDNWRHYMANQTQQTAPAGAGSPVDQQNGADDGFYPMQPFVILGGAQLLELFINVVQAPTAVDAFSRWRMTFRGVLAQGSTSVG